ncbi:MAG TPA: hypothetical protein VIM73_01075, partial [Polyangiaceae bacterium]
MSQWSYMLCAGVFAIGVVDQAFGGWTGVVFLGVFLIGVTVLVLLVTLPRRWSRTRWRSLVPLLT